MTLPLDVSPVVAAALREGRAVVALESTLISHGASMSAASVLLPTRRTSSVPGIATTSAAWLASWSAYVFCQRIAPSASRPTAAMCGKLEPPTTMPPGTAATVRAWIPSLACHRISPRGLRRMIWVPPTSAKPPPARATSLARVIAV